MCIPVLLRALVNSKKGVLRMLSNFKSNKRQIVESHILFFVSPLVIIIIVLFQVTEAILVT